MTTDCASLPTSPEADGFSLRWGAKVSPSSDPYIPAVASRSCPVCFRIYRKTVWLCCRRFRFSPNRQRSTRSQPVSQFVSGGQSCGNTFPPSSPPVPATVLQMFFSGLRCLWLFASSIVLVDEPGLVQLYLCTTNLFYGRLPASVFLLLSDFPCHPLSVLFFFLSDRRRSYRARRIARGVPDGGGDGGSQGFQRRAAEGVLGGVLRSQRCPGSSP